MSRDPTVRRHLLGHLGDRGPSVLSHATEGLSPGQRVYALAALVQAEREGLVVRAERLATRGHPVQWCLTPAGARWLDELEAAGAERVAS